MMTMSEQSKTRLRAPSANTVREQVGRFWELWLGAMFLKQETYSYERDSKNPFGNGLLYIAVVGVLVALAGILGAGLRYAIVPSSDAIKNTILVHIQAMPFFAMYDSTAADIFNKQFNQGWDLIGSRTLGYPVDPVGVTALVASVLTTPLGLVIGWLVYGALVHLIARGWNRDTSFGEMLAPLALATSPQLLNLVAVFPTAGASGVVISLWTWICSVFAIRVAYQTTTGRAIWAAVFPVLLAAILFLLLFLLIAAFFVPISRSVGGAQ
jgi:hypothetical protein